MIVTGGTTTTPKPKLKRKAKPKPKLTAEQRKDKKLKADHIRAARTVFRNVGFDRVSDVAEKDIEFLGQKGEFDDCFLYENILLLIEYTTSSSGNISDHLKHKKIIFDRVLQNQKAFLEYILPLSSELTAAVSSGYYIDRYKIVIVYCARNDFDDAVKGVVDSPRYLDFPILKYFEKISASVKLSALPEFLAFLGINPADVGEGGVIKKQGALVPYPGSILPEEASGFPPGYKVVSFYADAEALLQRAFVLRRKGWRGSNEAYQRMIIPSKIEAIRKSLRSKGQVAVNNIIATLPDDVLPIGSDGHTSDISTLTETKPVTITLPLRPNTIGLIDGQHRLFSYYKTRDDDKAIAKLRHHQNLLVTGIIYPKNIDEREAERFEASLFLTINSNQSSAPPELRQEIEVLLNPFSPTAISKQVIEKLASSGPLFGHVERYFYDKGKLKTSSIVNFGLVPLLKLSGPDSLFVDFPQESKDALAQGSSVALAEYVQHSVSRINIFLSAVKANISSHRWTTDPSVKDRMLTVTFINSFLITIRMLIQHKQSLAFEDLRSSLSGFDSFDTKPFSSSQYARMAEKIAKDHFSVLPVQLDSPETE
jgi:DGQHR domain-containing protein